MTRGALIFAYNNESIDYQRIAQLNEKLIGKNLGVPTTIITGTKERTNARTFRYGEESEVVSWHNTDRMTAYELSPYDETLLLDADYLILSDNLNFVWGTSSEFLCANSVYDVTGKNSFHANKMMSKYSFPLRWATCVYFRKTPYAKSIFDMMAEVRDNYEYYSLLFNFRAKPYRNDFALSVALQLLSGYNDNSNHFHFPLASLSTHDKIAKVKEDGTIIIEYESGDKTFQTRVKGTDLHVMDKHNLIDHITEFGT